MVWYGYQPTTHELNNTVASVGRPFTADACSPRTGRNFWVLLSANLDGTKSRTALRLLFCSYVWTYVNIVALPDVGCRRLARRSLALGPSLFLLLDGLHTP
ncbi:uncharacterized protein [Drosophila virilis]|uniref:uncharacterized protein n=1 Tax=Drosophila virilis TaxID=7244 RepID=UPI001396296E|nr:uncharacterized protein LOC26531920 isoform X2 [Drosophila virilis]